MLLFMLHLMPHTPVHTSTRVSTLLAILIILAGVTTSFFAFHQKSSTVDESVHEAAGYSYWATRDFGLNPEHPPLLKEIAALPLLFLHLESKADSAFFSQQNLWSFGPLFIFENTVDAETIQYAGRTSVLIFFVLLGVLTYRWARELFGEKIALVVLTFTMFSPNLLAHSPLITTDVAMTFAVLFASYTATQWLKHSSRKNFWWFTFALLVMFLTKFSALVVAPIFFVVLAVHSLLHTKRSQKKQWLAVVHDFFSEKFWPYMGALLLVVAGIMLFYSFDFQTLATSIDAKMFFETLAKSLPGPLQSFVLWFITHVPFPIFHFTEGAIMVITHNQGGHDSFLLGQTGNHGWWYYFPVLFFLKSSLVELFLVFGTVTVVLFSFLRPLILAKSARVSALLARLRTTPFDYFVLLLIPLLFFAMSMRSNLNLGLRHVLLVYPFVFLLSGIFLHELWKTVAGRVVVCVALIFSLAIALLSFPNYLSYFNPLLGGNTNARNIAVDSNVDWGQDLKALAKYLKDRDIHRVYLAYFGTSRPSYYGISYDSVPTFEQIKENGPIHGTVVVSATLLAHPNPDIAWVLTKKPDTILNGSLYIFTF